MVSALIQQYLFEHFVKATAQSAVLFAPPLLYSALKSSLILKKHMADIYMFFLYSVLFDKMHQSHSCLLILYCNGPVYTFVQLLHPVLHVYRLALSLVLITGM